MNTPTHPFAPEQRQELLDTLKARFQKHPNRHPGLEWAAVQARLEAAPGKLAALYEMESSGGEPDVLGRAEPAGELLFVDCCPESPQGRRNTCYDREARLERKTLAPANSALEMAADLGIELLTEEQYRELQKFGPFDTKTSSWIHTPADIRKLGGALFADHRYGHVFVYHNGAPSYYGARGFRGLLRV